MHRASPITRSYLTLAGALSVFACQVYTLDMFDDTTETGGSGASGGTGGAFGGSGGSVPTGGRVEGTGGVRPTGGDGGAEPTGGNAGAKPTGGTGGTEPTGGSGGTEPTGGSGGSPPTGGASGTGGVPPTGGTGGTGGATVDPGLIDDFEVSNNSIQSVSGRSGYWYPLFDASETGEISPATSSTFRPTDLPDGPREESDRGLRVTANDGFIDYGAGFGFNLANEEIYDLSPYTGIRFFARGGDSATDDQVLELRVPIADIVPDNRPGGMCTEDCDNSHRTTFTVPVAWTLIEIPFDTLVQDGTWGLRVDFDPQHALAVQFWAEAPGIAFDVWLDDIFLY